MVDPRLETEDRVVERVQRVTARRIVQLDDGRRRRPFVPEVRNRLARHAHRQVRHERRRPGAGGHDDDVGVQLVERRHAPSRLDSRAARNGEIEKRVAREVGAHDTRLGLMQRCPAGRQDDAELPRRGGVERPVGSTARVERRSRGQLGRRGELDEPVEPQQLRAGLRLELAPAGDRLGGETHPVRLRIRKPDDPGAAVARAASVIEVELLDDGHLGAVLGQRPGGGAAHHAGTDDRDACHAATVLRSGQNGYDGSSSSTLSPARTRSFATASPVAITSPGSNRVFAAARVRTSSSNSRPSSN